MGLDRTILLADDARMFRELGALFLARCGRVITAATGAEALELARRHPPSVVVADLDMPDLGGDALCEALREDPQLAEVPVILVVSSDAGSDRARAIRAGASDVLSKPINRMALIQAVNRFARGSRVPGLARVQLETEVTVRHQQREWVAVARNLSRGGIFIEGEAAAAPGSELALEFRLPETQAWLAPTAQVIWRRRGVEGLSPGLGLRFLDLDGHEAREIDTYVYERAIASAPPTLAPAGGAR